MHLRRVLLGSLLVIGLGIGLGACSSSKSAAPKDCTPITGHHITVVARNLAWQNVKCLQSKAGETVSVTLDNQDTGIAHDWAFTGPVKEDSAKTKLTTGPDRQSVTYTPTTPGTYTFVCDIHANMESTYVVTK